LFNVGLKLSIHNAESVINVGTNFSWTFAEKMSDVGHASDHRGSHLCIPLPFSAESRAHILPIS
jgi:hypothetical protein